MFNTSPFPYREKCLNMALHTLDGIMPLGATLTAEPVRVNAGLKLITLTFSLSFTNCILTRDESAVAVIKYWHF